MSEINQDDDMLDDDTTQDTPDFEAQAKEYLAGWQRAKADLVNAQKDAIRQRGDTTQYVRADIMRGFLTIMDTFEQALAHKPAGDEQVQSWVAGMESVHQVCVKFCDGYGVRKMEHSTQPDPYRHEVVGVVEREGAQSGEIVEMVQAGYMMEDKVLRPAKVLIAK